MANAQELKVTERDMTLTPRELRGAGYIPVTLYGKGFGSQCLQVRAHDFNLFYLKGIRQFQLVGFVNETVKAQQVQKDPVAQQTLSIEFWVSSPVSANTPQTSKNTKTVCSV